MRRFGWPTTKNPLRVIGLISGTSVDGIDAALVEVRRRSDGVDVRTLATYTCEFSPKERERILDLCQANAPVEAVCAANFDVAEWFAQAALSALRIAGLFPDDWDLVASHGQTLWHIPGHSTLQIGDAAVIAERTGLPVISNFRPRDIAAGGQGAPLVSYVDSLLFGDPTHSRAVQNLGGIGNVTYIPAGASSEPIVSFDTGPGNIVIDGVARLVAGQDRDNHGKIAAEGQVSHELLKELLADQYFGQRPPKTTGREKFGAAYAREVVEQAKSLGLPPEDLLATATMLTVRSIADAYRNFLPAIDEVIVSGGGVHNETLMHRLREALAPIPVYRSSDYGVDPDFKEAIAFAVLGAETAWGNPGNLPSATGAGRRVILGSITPSD